MYHLAASGRIKYLAVSNGYKINGYIVHELGFRVVCANN
jgi:hypothetical protein